MLALDLTGSDAVPCDVGAGFNGPVWAIASAGDFVFVGGAFSEYRGETVNSLAKLDASTCELDTLFSPPSGATGFDGVVNALLVSGTSVYVGGELEAYRGVTLASGLLAKLDVTTGAADAAFDAAVGEAIFAGSARALAISGSSLFVGGLFAGNSSNFDELRNFARFDATSGVETTPMSEFGTEGFDGAVSALAVVGTALYVGGSFGEYRVDSTPAADLVKLDVATLDLDTAFAPDVASVTALVASETALFVGGRFSSPGFGGDSQVGLQKLDLATGETVSMFSPAANDVPTVSGFGVASLALAAGVLFVGGGFANGDGTVNGFIALDEATGALVGSPLPSGHDVGGFDGTVRAIASGAERVWVGGDFQGYGGRRGSYLVKLDDRTFEVDERFSPPDLAAFDGPVNSLVVADGALYVGGRFTSYRGVPNSANGLAKLDLQTGELDTTFSPPGESTNGVSGEVHVLLVAGDSLLVGGDFTSYRTDPVQRLVKVALSDGAPDTVFTPEGVPVGFDDTVRALAISGSSVFVGGEFEGYLPPSTEFSFCVGLAKLDVATGEFDATFAPAVDFDSGFDSPDVRALAVSEGALYVGGRFDTYQGASANAIAKLDLATGMLDTTFSPPANNGFDGSVDSLLLLGSSLYVGGDMFSYRGEAGATRGLAKLDPVSGARDPAFTTGRWLFGFESPFRVLVPDGDRLFVGGGFGYLDGTSWVSRAAFIDPATGALR
ncbi:MAG: hypothetical protein KC621_00050 [Myxococcales bacterium]|nr:hypothetical protein [Myxococcales bacterium]